MKIEGKTAVVIGGAQGMGAACVDALLSKGGKVNRLLQGDWCVWFCLIEC